MLSGAPVGQVAVEVTAQRRPLSAALLWPGWLAEALAALNDSVPAAPSKANVAAAAASLSRMRFGEFVRENCMGVPFSVS